MINVISHDTLSEMMILSYAKTYISSRSSSFNNKNQDGTEGNNNFDITLSGNKYFDITLQGNNYFYRVIISFDIQGNVIFIP